MLKKLRNLILGEHPNNTVCSYNWHTVRHIRRFLTQEIQALDSDSLSVADIGGGKSPYYPWFAEKTSEYICVDQKESFPADDTRSIRFVEGTAENIPLETDSVDVALCSQVLEHVTDPVKAAAELFRILKPGGTVMGSVPHVCPVHREAHDYRRFTEAGVTRLLTDSGFSDCRTSGSGGVFTAAAFIIMMDMFLSKKKEGKGQKFHSATACILSPLVCIWNISALAADTVFGNRHRTPANICFTARKADIGS